MSTPKTKLGRPRPRLTPAGWAAELLFRESGLEESLVFGHANIPIKLMTKFVLWTTTDRDLPPELADVAYAVPERKTGERSPKGKSAATAWRTMFELKSAEDITFLSKGAGRNLFGGIGYRLEVWVEDGKVEMAFTLYGDTNGTVVPEYTMPRGPVDRLQALIESDDGAVGIEVE